MKRFYILFAILCSFITAKAQFGVGGGSDIVGKISGSLVDSVTKQPLDYASVGLYRVGGKAPITGAISDEKGKVTYDGAFVTSLPITAENVVEIAACARARWKIENETFNVLKNNGYNLTHNFGHGKKYLARIFATMNLLAFAFHTACDCLETLWQQARQALGTRKGFFQDFHAICSYVVFASWKHLMETLITGKAAPPT